VTSRTTKSASGIRFTPQLFSNFVFENSFRVCFGWSMIREWSWNFSWTREPIPATLQTDHGHNLVNMRINFKQFNSGLQNESRTRRSPLDDLDANILDILAKYPLESARSIAETLRVAHSTMLLHLHDYVNFRPFHLHWVQHLLKHDLLRKPMEYEQVMPPVLHAAEPNGWHLLTGNVSCSFLNISQHPVWTLSRDDRVIKPRLAM
jgi:hypothetical protein